MRIVGGTAHARVLPSLETSVISALVLKPYSSKAYGEHQQFIGSSRAWVSSNVLPFKGISKEKAKLTSVCLQIALFHTLFHSLEIPVITVVHLFFGGGAGHRMQGLELGKPSNTELHPRLLVLHLFAIIVFLLYNS